MKVAVFLTNKISPQHGGGFSFTERLIHALDSYNFPSPIEIVFVGRVPKNEISLKRPYYQLASNFSYRFFNVLEKLNVLSLFRKAFKIDLNVQNKGDVAVLNRNKIHVILFVKQAHQEVFGFPFISMNWDIGHMTSYAFPEFVSSPTFEDRQDWYLKKLQKSFAVFVESESGKKELERCCNIDPRRIFVIPMFPGKVVEMSVSEEDQLACLRGLKLQSRRFFYYPAQFWAHKNHVNLILAFKELLAREKHSDLKLVFSGSDQGNKEHIKNLIEELGLSADVVLLGFISNEEVFTLYRNAIALVMPTFLGPTNMPLLEAQALQVPVICSDFEGHREICEDSAVYVQPSDSESITDAMMLLLDENFYHVMVQRTIDVGKRSHFNLNNALSRLSEAFLKLAPIRKTFP